MIDAPNKHAKEIRCERLRLLRTEKGKTQEDIAKQLSLSRSTILKMECGYQDINSDYLCSLARYYGTTSDYILGLSEVRHTQNTLPACDELGLSDVATVKLKGLQGKGRYSRIISKIIEHDRFEDFLAYIETALVSAEHNSSCDDITLSRLVLSEEEVGHTLIPAEQEKDYSIYMASMLLRGIVDDITCNFFHKEEKRKVTQHGEHQED